ncbi:accessory Sec system protein Asp2 [Staphylococcus auricularis]|uniref:Accessory Sec system protein Asp2 n=1 Tax=Staphylococcus auricularis TaxID=29379 RepID=A0AAW7MCI3_9STAP|nr:accessory Sec system protein Asp2 [Staphylococcus auricularis]MDC6327257.1 accessory Sec system protein Asp2 [Staphylococcus auricularis]MDN4533029.1 accessory Sec system protein Asp2 [Staphylococcus auricularis]
MARKFKALQIGGRDLEAEFAHKKSLEWDYFDTDLFTFDSGYMDILDKVIESVKAFDFVYVEAPYSEDLMRVLRRVTTPYTTHVDQHYWDAQFEADEFVRTQLIRPFRYEDEADRIEKLHAVTFPGQYGDRISPRYAQVNPNFNGTAHYNGNYRLVVSGDFGETLQPIVTWKMNLVYDKDKVIQVWPEFNIEGEVSLTFTFRLMMGGSIDAPMEEIVLTDKELETPLEISRKPDDAIISVSVKARGQGTIHFGALHKRWSRLEYGQHILGGSRFVDDRKEELMYYFNPGDLKPPLNVYFSGYRPAEGFEAFFLMSKLDAPFLLISDPRLEGGAFYIGSDTYEQGVKDIIQQSLERLSFADHELILSGLSMGSFGALYYGAQLNPSAIIVGKPLLSLGTVADNMKLLRPEDFGTANDLLVANEGGMTEEHIHHLDRKFWDMIETADVQQTTFAIAYMQHDDYDPRAFPELLPILSAQHAKVMSRGVPGRHNDDTPTITSWFVNFYHLILESQFGRVKYDNKA